MVQSLLLFADRLPPLIGGMEMHAHYFIKYFKNHPQYPLISIVTKNAKGEDYLLRNQGSHLLEIKNLPQFCKPSIIFFNSGRWIEKMSDIRYLFPQATFIYRTGGNEVLKADLIEKKIFNHSLRQAFWVQTINHTIDRLITNSFYTESRLREIGITCPFIRCVGGVNTDALKVLHNSAASSTKLLTIFCAARFVPYKNHQVLVNLIYQLVLLGYDLRLRLAGEGPLLFDIKQQVKKNNLEGVIQFLGPLDNEATCREIAQANVYMQLSRDYLTEVPGGSYIHSEGMGRSILEALTAGTFIIAGKSGALSEIVTKNRGLLVEVNNTDQLLKEVEPLIKNPPPRLPFLEVYSWKRLFEQYEKLWEAI